VDEGNIAYDKPMVLNTLTDARAAVKDEIYKNGHGQNLHN
jgi:hypothetical protein